MGENAPLMKRRMGDVNFRDCLMYLDDIAVLSSAFEEHVQRLKRLEVNNLKLKASLCEFFKGDV